MTEHKTNRPVFLNLTRIHFPVMAVLSLGHRITGVLLVVAIPPLVYLFDRSLADAAGYAEVAGLLHGGAARVALILLIWALAHHLLAGIRFLLIDMDIGSDVRHGRATTWAVLAGGIIIMFCAVLTLP